MHIHRYGDDNVDCYLSDFTPLEWAVVERRMNQRVYAKVVVHKADNDRVLGMHIVSPNAGEIIQGFGTAIRQNIRYQDLLDTVGIHPTLAEEFVLMSVTRSSGGSTAKAGC